MLIAALLAAALAQDAAPAKPAEKDPLVCRKEMVVGSKLPQKICMTKSQRDALAKAGRETTADLQSGARMYIPPVPPS